MCDENHHTQITYVLTALLMDFQGIAVKNPCKLLTKGQYFLAGVDFYGYMCRQ